MIIRIAALVLAVGLLAGCTSPAPSASPAATSAPAPTTVPPPTRASEDLAKALLADADVAALGFSTPTTRDSRAYPDGLERCGEVPSDLERPDQAETVGWTLASPATEVVQSVARYSTGGTAERMAELSATTVWCAPGEQATHRQPIPLPELANTDARYAVCYVWLALTWCNIVLQRGDVISGVRLGWGVGSKMSLATVPLLAAAAAKKM